MPEGESTDPHHGGEDGQRSERSFQDAAPAQEAMRTVNQAPERAEGASVARTGQSRPSLQLHINKNGVALRLLVGLNQVADRRPYISRVRFGRILFVLLHLHFFLQ